MRIKRFAADMCRACVSGIGTAVGVSAGLVLHDRPLSGPIEMAVLQLIFWVGVIGGVAYTVSWLTPKADES